MQYTWRSYPHVYSQHDIYKQQLISAQKYFLFSTGRQCSLETSPDNFTMSAAGGVSLNIVLVLCLVVTFAYGQQAGRKDDASKCNKKYSCASCNEVRICTQSNGFWVEKIVFSCSSATPYCDHATGTCSSVPSLGCAPKAGLL